MKISTKEASDGSSSADLLERYVQLNFYVWLNPTFTGIG